MRRILLSIVLAASVTALPAWAGKPDHAGKGGKGKGRGPDSSRADVDVDVHFSSDARGAWRDWYVGQYGPGHCPPGLAKKQNGCLPPGLAKKRYRIGYPLSPDVVVVAVPVSLSGRLGPPPAGYRFGIVDGDLVQLAVGSLLVVDAIDGLAD
jgi:hypothetical protein